jgi:pimeloyl-ACP methyl ester carboxylesterase
MTTREVLDLGLVPGSGCDGRLFEPQIDALRGAARPYVVENTTRPRIDHLAREMLGRLPARFALAGLSQGGLVALEIVRQALQRVTGLALLDTLPGRGLRIDRVRHRLAIAMLAARAFGPIDRIMWPRYVAPAHLDDTGLHDVVRAMMHATGARGLINQQRIFLTRPDYRPLLPQIAVPTLVLVGDQDTLAPVEAAGATAAAIPDAELITVTGSGHLTTLESPAAVTSALQQWLDRVRRHVDTPAPAASTPRTAR